MWGTCPNWAPGPIRGMLVFNVAFASATRWAPKAPLPTCRPVGVKQYGAAYHSLPAVTGPCAAARATGRR
jgi:hypothetical protein